MRYGLEYDVIVVAVGMPVPKRLLPLLVLEPIRCWLPTVLKR